MPSRIDQELNVSQTALGLRTYRQELLASNIANADTPNFKARDIDFGSSLKAAIGKTPAGQLPLNQTATGHLAGSGGNRYGATVQYRTDYQSSVDGNTVNMDVERGAFAENALHMEALLSFVREKFKDLNAAVQP